MLSSLRRGIIGLSAMSMAFSTSNAGLTEHPLGNLNDLPEGEMKRVQIGDKKDNFIIIIKKQGGVSALSGKCCHFNLPLDGGYFDGMKVWCPFHRAAFCSGSGALVGSPGLNNLTKYQVGKKGEEYFVYIPEDKVDSVSAHQIPNLTKPDPSDNSRFVIVGGGYAGQIAAESLRKGGFKGKIVMLTNESLSPYDRIILSKNLRAEASRLVLRPLDFYTEYGIEVVKNTQVTQLDTHNKTVKTASGEQFPYDKVLLATGTSARIFHPQALKNSNVFTLRNAADHNNMKPHLQHANNVVIVGGSFIGMEVACSLRKNFPEQKITIIELQKVPMALAFGPDVATQLVDMQKKNNIEVISGAKVTKFNDENGKVVSIDYEVIEQSNQSGNVPADLVLLATGAKVNTEYVPAELLQPDGAVKVNQFLQTDDPNVYAAGDIASFHSCLTEDNQRVEHWQVAGDQGMVVSANMLDKGKKYDKVPFFWTNQFLNAQFVGFGHGSDSYYTEIENETVPEKTTRLTYFFKGQKVIGVAMVNKPKACIILTLALENGLMPTKNQLVRAEVTYADIQAKVEKLKARPCCGGK